MNTNTSTTDLSRSEAIELAEAALLGARARDWDREEDLEIGTDALERVYVLTAAGLLSRDGVPVAEFSTEFVSMDDREPVGVCFSRRLDAAGRVVHNTGRRAIWGKGLPMTTMRRNKRDHERWMGSFRRTGRIVEPVKPVRDVCFSCGASVPAANMAGTRFSCPCGENWLVIEDDEVPEVETFDISAIQPLESVRMRNAARRIPASWDSHLECVVCSRPVNGDRAIFVECVEGGLTAWPQDAGLEADHEDSGYMGCFAVGPTCAKKIPARYHCE